MANMTKQDWLSALSNMFQFILGFLLGVTLIAGSAVGAAYYYFKKVSSTVPEKPVYTEETSSPTQAEPDRQTNTKANQPQLETTSTNNTVEELEPIIEETLPPNAYYARVTWSQGLSLRAEPSLDASRIGGIGYNSKIIILEDSADKRWQRVRISGSQQEGWVKAGNVKKVTD